jgi:apolipoprotein N-acyltransferase
MRRGCTEKLISMLCSSLSGLLLIMIFPLWDRPCLAWVAMIPLLWLARVKKGRHHFWLGWWAGIIFFYGLLYWLPGTMTRFGGMPVILSHLTLLLLSLYLGLYVGAFFTLLRHTYQRIRIPFIILAPTIWVALEWIRSFFLTGFPWGLLGYSQARSLHILQMADLAGVYGISFLIVFVNAGLTDLIALYTDFLSGQRSHLAMAYRSLALGLSLSLVIAYGAFRLNPKQFVRPEAEGLSLALIQGNIPQEMKRDIASGFRILDDYGQTSARISQGNKKLIIWPETACTVTLLPGEGTVFLSLSEWAERIGAHLLLGCPRYDIKGKGSFNSAVLFSPSGDLAGFYDKIHLVPFGEYFPFEWVARSLGNLGSFSSGRDFTVLEAQGNRFAVIICFEAIFPDLCRRFVKRGAEFLVNLTNDAWFGKTAAPYQHFDMACMRAVENRVWLVRVANTGISAIVDPWGRVIEKGGIFERLIIEGEIHKSPLKSIYVNAGDLFAYICFFFTLLWCIWVIRKVRKGEYRDV